MNVVMVQGTLSRAPELRVLPSGDRFDAAGLEKQMSAEEFNKAVADSKG